MTIIVAGYIVGYPLGGMTWHHLNYLLGLAELGHDVWFYEDSGQWLPPYNPAINDCTDDPGYGINYLQQTFDSVRLPHKFCYRSELQDRYYGLTREAWLDVVRRADCLIAVSGVTPWREEFEQIPSTCVIDTDPVFTQLRMRNDAGFVEYYTCFDHVATFGNLVGTPGCPLPTAGFDWIGTNQPIALDHWPVKKTDTRTFSTIGKWEFKTGRDFEFAGQSYASSKGVEWVKLLDLPARSPWTMEMAMSALPAETQQRFASHGWHFVDPTEASISTDAFRSFIQSKAGELTVAKQIYAGLPSGWFSDRSACFLASGRPVITQSSGFEQWLPTGEGLFSFATPDEAANALEAVNRDYAHHATAARRIAEQHFDAAKVLPRLLERIL